MLPALDNWKTQNESPEASPDFNDSSWQVADKMTTNSISGANTLPVLYADDYGFHTGNTWYRGRFVSDGSAKGVHLVSDSGGGAQAFSAWLNGHFLGSSTSGSGDFTFPAGSVHLDGDNVLSVLTVNMGHEEDYNSTNANKTARGLTSASLISDPLNSITWRIQGVRGGENLVDQVRGPLNNGGLYGERAGWSLPGYPDSDWRSVSLPTHSTRPGVAWYRDEVALNLPPGQDTSIGLTFTDDPSRKYRVEIFVNGWMMGNYVNYLGPQHSFPIPNGILRTNGQNTIALAVWNLDGTTGGLGKVKLTDYGTYASSLRVRDVASPGYSAATYAMPAAPGTTVRLAVPSTTAASQTFTATTTVRVPAGSPAATSVKALLELPSGWTATPQTPVSVAELQPGQAFTVRWTVTVPAGTLPQASAIRTVVHYRQDGKRQSNADERIVRAVPPPPPAGTDAVSDLPFVSSTNGWGPVERDTSNGESAAGDGKTITINGVTYTKGLGTNSTSDVSIYLAGRCTTFSADVGVDDETNGGGTVTFRVVGDGTTLASTGTIKAHTAAQHITADVTGVQLLELIVGDAGDGNGLDHGDWAMPTLTCS